MAFAKLHHRQNSKGERIYYVEYRLPGRKNTKFTIGNVEARKAKEIADNIRALIIQGIDPHEYAREQAKYSKEKPRLKLSELEDAYLKYCSITNQPTTLELKTEAFKNLRGFLGDCYVDIITPEQIESWMSSLKPSKTTINKKLRVIRAMFNWGFKRNMVKMNPFANSGIKQYSVPDSNPEDYYTLEEVKLILHTLQETDQTLWRLVYLALETGGRLSELLALTGGDIDTKNMRVLFKGPTTKTGQRRFVPIRPTIIDELKSWELEKDKKLFSWKCAKSASRKFRFILQNLNLWGTGTNTRSFHTLRHTYASYLLIEGINIFTVSRWMGHSSVRVTEKHYGHLIPDTVEVKLPW